MTPLHQLQSLDAFSGPEHQPFIWESGDHAALLVHGFPGTPAEFRGLAEALHQDGISVAAVLLPGFGPEIATLHTRTHQEWTHAVEQSYSQLKRQFRQVTLIGNSMGGSLVLQAAANFSAERVVALAPFWQMARVWHRMLWPAINLFVKEFRPYQKADFADPAVARDLNRIFKNVDLGDPDVKAALREIRIPTCTVNEVQRIGMAAFKSSSRVLSPTLVVQGTHDPLVTPGKTKRLMNRLQGPKQYIEVAAGHDLLDPGGPTWPEVKTAVLEFLLESPRGEER